MSSPGFQKSFSGLQKISSGLQQISSRVQKISSGPQKISSGPQKSSSGLQKSSSGARKTLPLGAPALLGLSALDESRLELNAFSHICHDLAFVGLKSVERVCVRAHAACS